MKEITIKKIEKNMANASMLIRRVIKLSCDTMQAARLLGCLWSCAFFASVCVCMCMCLCVCVGFAACLTLTSV